MDEKQKFRTPSFEIESQHQGPHAGVDEVGCGAWAGPVIAAAVILPKNCDPSFLNLINDSKRLSLMARENAYAVLQELPDVIMGIGSASVEEIDALNIRQASFLAMRRALNQLKLPPKTVLVDGRFIIPSCPYPCYAYTKGDQRSYSIAAASIIAKVTRDNFMKKISQDHPEFGWSKNVGYGTKKHRDSLQIHGPTQWHRKSYRPIAELLEQVSQSSS